MASRRTLLLVGAIVAFIVAAVLAATDSTHDTAEVVLVYLGLASFAASFLP